MRILDRYILAELLKVFVFCISFLMALLILEKVNFLLSITQGSFSSPLEMIRLIAYFSPAFLVVSIPLATLLASLVTFSQLSADNEITALRAGGISFFRILVPVIIFSVFSYGISLYLALNVQHVGKYRFMTLLTQVISNKISSTLQERVFYDRLPNTVIYVSEKPVGGDGLKGIFIYDKSSPENPRFITAASGKLVTSPDRQSVVLALKNGSIYSGDPKSYRMISYEEYEFMLNIGGHYRTFEKGEREMSVPEIERRISAKRERGISTLEDEVEMHKRFSLPFASLVLGMLGASLGTRLHRGGRWGGVTTGIAMIMLNYLLFMLAEGLGKGGVIPASTAMWLPNIILGVLALFLIFKTSRETMPFRTTIFIQSAWLSIMRRFSRR